MTDYLTLKDAGAQFSLSERTLRKYIRAGDLAAYRLVRNGRILLRRSEVERWLESRREVIERDGDARAMLEALLA